MGMFGTTDSTPERDQFTIAIACPGCEQTGAAVWEENSKFSASGPQTVLIRLSDGFYERIGKTSPHDIEMICSRCGKIQP
jgi:hypothetical protein